MNLTRAQKIRLGAFVLGSLGLLLIVVLTLAGLRIWEPRTIYRARFKESVGGLEPSAPVKYQGLRLGRVESMQIAVDDPSAIEVTLAIDPEAVLYEGTQAVLDSSGLTGLKTINLTPGDPRKPRLAPGSLLPTGHSFLDKLTDSASTIVADVSRITEQISRWTSDDNRFRVENLLTGLNVFIGNIDKMMTQNRDPFGELLREVNTAVVNIGEAAHETTETLRVVRKGFVTTTNELDATLISIRRPLQDIDPKVVAQTFSSVRDAAHSLDQRLSAKETGQAIASMGDAVNRANNLIQDVDMAVRAGRDDFAATLSYLRQAAEDLREFSRILAQNPSVLVRGREVGE